MVRGNSGERNSSLINDAAFQHKFEPPSQLVVGYAASISSVNLSIVLSSVFKTGFLPAPFAPRSNFSEPSERGTQMIYSTMLFLSPSAVPAAVCPSKISLKQLGTQRFEGLLRAIALSFKIINAHILSSLQAWLRVCILQISLS